MLCSTKLQNAYFWLELRSYIKQRITTKVLGLSVHGWASVLRCCRGFLHRMPGGQAWSLLTDQCMGPRTSSKPACLPFSFFYTPIETFRDNSCLSCVCVMTMTPSKGVGRRIWHSNTEQRGLLSKRLLQNGILKQRRAKQTSHQNSQNELYDTEYIVGLTLELATSNHEVSNSVVWLHQSKD